MKRKLLGRMIHVASMAHKDQFDRAGMPYILHPLQVMHLLNTQDEQLQCIAVGHDLIEDTQVTALDLEEFGFPARVIHGIIDLTKQQDEPLYDYKVRVKANPDAVRVKICDLQHNSMLHRLNAVKPRDIERMGEYILFYKELLECL
jgi:(p)ppGpp synthase/HD superfamily hydrolase